MFVLPRGYALLCSGRLRGSLISLLALLSPGPDGDEDEDEEGASGSTDTTGRRSLT
jgi:hypothetical protein